MITVYGIKNCDTIKKALKWLTDQSVAHHFHDFRKDGLERQMLQGWVTELGLDVVLNKRGTTWRKLPDADKESLTEATAIDLMLEQPAMIKRPVFDFGDHRRVGFAKKDVAEIEALLQSGL
ncbi:ArsC family reductase [Paremcibacter congregatus]|uniref:ArsC family reductase n=1 Tax=Paremcibacter congregatus TaxID=2043170 RepID=UPI003A8CCE6F|tara:strand:- start:1164 stop:1526 length:363 start_codon:yes stop_codon:yes gene_type:complete